MRTLPCWQPASVSRKAINDGLIDVGDGDPGLGQPVREVARCIIVGAHR
jgi:hypothetical protein